jgi:hypothetical protein
MAEVKTKRNNGSVEKFIASSPVTRREDAVELLKLMKQATGMKPALWGNTTASFVGFGMYHYKSERSTQEGDWPLTGFSPRKANLTVYIMSGFKNHTALLKKLGKYKASGGSCLYINKLSDIDQAVLAKVIQASVKEMKKRYPDAILK